MSKKFDCPACSAPMEYEGGDSLFQNCSSCGAPIVVPSSIVQRDRDERIESTVGMPPAKVLEAESISQIHEHLDKEEARVEEVKESGEVIDPILADSKNEIENIIQRAEPEELPADSPSPESFSPMESGPNISKQIYDEIRAGRKINAIKIYREAYNTSLQDAKEAVENIIGQENLAAENVQQEPIIDSPVERLGAVLQQLQSGNKIFAIKLFREQFRTGLKEAKDAVDAMERGESINISDYL